MCNLRFILTLLLLTVLVAAYDFGEAASIIDIAPTGASVYSIAATDLQESAGIDLLISYDKDALEVSQVSSGALTTGALMEKNTATPGIVRIVFITAGVIKGSGVLASITFKPKGTAQASQPKLSSSVYAASGTQLAVQSTSDTPQPPPENKSEGGVIKNSAVASSTATGGGSAMSGAGFALPSPIPNSTQITTTPGTVSLPQEPAAQNDLLRDDVRKEGRREETAYQNVPANSGAVAGGGTATSRESTAPVDLPDTKTSAARSTFKSSQSVLDRFRTYQDVRTVKRLATLFDQSALHAAGIIQSPAIVVTDGKALMTVTIDLDNQADTPSFSLKGANLKSIRRVSDKKWELVALPQKGKIDVRLSILLKGERNEIPLVAVPPIDKTGAGLTALSAAALDTLLAKPLINNKPAYDLNADGRQDYLDDYILIAHWLLEQRLSVNGVGRKPAAAGR